MPPQTSEAADKCLNEKRKTINGEDILTSMRALGFDNYEGVLKIYLAKYREVSLASHLGRHLHRDHDHHLEIIINISPFMLTDHAASNGSSPNKSRRGRQAVFGG